jgi:hypothetical protein
MKLYNRVHMYLLYLDEKTRNETKLIYTFYPNQECKENFDLHLIFFLWGNSVHIFLANSCIDLICFLQIHYSLILKIASVIPKIFLLYSTLSTDRYYNTKPYATSSDYFLNNSGNKLFCFGYLFSDDINSFHLSFFELIFLFHNT